MNKVKKCRKRPVVIECMEFVTNNEPSQENMNAIVEWVTSNGGEAHHDGTCIFIETLEGTHKAMCKDFILRGVQGEFYPCKPDIFHSTYDVEV